MSSTNKKEFSATYLSPWFYTGCSLSVKKARFSSSLVHSLHVMIRTKYESETFTEGRIHKSVSSPKISISYRVPFDQKSFLNYGFLIRYSILSETFLVKYGSFTANI